MQKISGSIFLIISILTATAILTRLITNINFIGLYELIGATSGIGIIFAFIVAEVNNSHIKIEIIKFNNKRVFLLIRLILMILVYFCFACAQLWAAYVSFIGGHKTIMLEIPTFLFYSCAGFCFLYLSIIATLKLINIKTYD